MTRREVMGMEFLGKDSWHLLITAAHNLVGQTL